MNTGRIVIASRSGPVSGLLADAINRVKPGCDIRCADTEDDIIEELKGHGQKTLFIEAGFYRRATTAKVPELVSRFPSLSVVVFALEDYDDFFIKRFIRCGVDGYISFRDGARVFEDGIREILAGHYVIPPEYEDAADGELIEFRPGLTAREIQIIMLILQEKDNNAIAAALDLAPQTVKNRRTVIYEKLHVKNSVGLVKAVLLKGLLAVEEFLRM